LPPRSKPSWRLSRPSASIAGWRKPFSPGLCSITRPRRRCSPTSGAYLRGTP
jgi:hypothetical protein